MVARQLQVIAFIAIFLPLIADGLRYVVIGDWGDDNANQYAVADAMSNWCSPTNRGPCDFIVNTGDNFYPDGVTSADDPRFNTTWRWIYDLPNINDLVWFNTVGNHDYGLLDDRELYQVEYGTTNPLWNMPWLWYEFYKTGADGTVVHFIAVDTMSLILRKHDSASQLAFIEQALASSTADWKILIGHNPPYSAGGHAPGTAVPRNELVPLCNKYNVDIFFNGDEHNLEHITSANVTDYVISGAGGRGLYDYSPVGGSIVEGWGMTIDYFGYHFGFVAVDMTKTSYTAEFLDETLAVRYSYTRVK
jgi:hypothetical protein